MFSGSPGATKIAADSGNVVTAENVANVGISGFTIDGGGGESTGGEYALSGTIGQPDASSAMEGGDYDLTGGFWGGMALGSMPPTPVTGEITVYLPLVDR